MIIFSQVKTISIIRMGIVQLFKKKMAPALKYSVETIRSITESVSTDQRQRGKNSWNDEVALAGLERGETVSRALITVGVNGLCF